jgi:MSHA biogenesis protein MshI
MNFFGKNRKPEGWMVIAFKDDGIQAISLKQGQGKPVVESSAYYPAADKTALAKPLAALGKDLNASRYRCSNLLGSAEYQLLSVDAPNVPRHELKTAIRWRLKDLLDYHVDDATLDVLEVPANKEVPGAANSMFVVAARNPLIAHRQALFEEARLPLSVIDIPEMAQRNISALLEPPGRGLGMLSFDETGGLLTVTCQGELYLARRLDVSAGQLAHASDADRDGLYDRITLELQRSFDHFDRQYRHVTLSKLMLCPLGDAAAPLQAHLTANLYFPVEVADLGDLVDLSRAPELKQPRFQQRFFLTVGAALRQEEVAL